MPKLPAPITAPTNLGGDPARYRATAAELAALARVRAGDQFLWMGRHRLATCDALSDGRGGVFIEACVKHGAMPSGWALADISIWPPAPEEPTP